jgi:phosphotriesterase-related protein
MLITSVQGKIGRDSLGITLPHEHIFIDLSNEFTAPSDPGKRKLSEEQITLENYGVLRRNPYAIRDNLILDDLDLSIEEVGRFAQVGGKTIVDCTCAGLNPVPERLREVALRTGVNIVAGSGYYTYDTHPAGMDDWSAEKIADDIVRELTVGIDGTDVCAGVIGEIGLSDPAHPNEMKCLAGAAIAQAQTGVPVQVHTHPWGRTAGAAIDVLTRGKVDPTRVAICHIDVEFDLSYLRSLLETGVYIQFDNFGKEFYINKADRGYASGNFATDLERVRTIVQLLDWGYANRILVTNDICLKQMLHRYGGWGYDHILTNIVPMMQDEGIPQGTIDRFLVQNPADWLCGSVG